LAPGLILVLIGVSFLPLYGAPQAENACRQSLNLAPDPSLKDSPIVVSIHELQKHPEDFYGRTVTVKGELHRDFTDNVFTIEDNGFFRDKDILVISTVSKAETVIPLQDSIKSGKNVLVTGVVQPYDHGKLECAYGPLNLERRKGYSFTKNPVLIVDRTQRAKAEPRADLDRPSVVMTVAAPARPEIMPEAAPVQPTPETAPVQPTPEPVVAPTAPLKPAPAMPRTAGNLALLLVAGVAALCGGLVRSPRAN
jgi:hypothetical protein